MTDEQLKDIAYQAAESIRKEPERPCFLGCYNDEGGGGRLIRMRGLENLCVEKYGPKWVTDKRAKAAVFQVIANARLNWPIGTWPEHVRPPEVMVIGGGARFTRDSSATGEGLYVIVQTTKRVCVLTEPKGQTAEIRYCDQDKTSGLMKMFL